MCTLRIVVASLVAMLFSLSASASEPTSSLIRIYTVGETFGAGITQASKREKLADAWTRTGWDITRGAAFAHQQVTGAAPIKDKELRTIDALANITIEYGSPTNTGRCLYDGSLDSEYGCLRALVPKYRDVVIGTVSYDKDARAYLLVMRRLRHTKLLDDVCEQTIPEGDTDGIGLVVAAASVTDLCTKQMFRNVDLTIRNPGHASILVDDKVTTQEQLRVTAGKHVIKATREGFDPWSDTIECKADSPCTVVVALKPKEVAVAPKVSLERRPPDQPSRVTHADLEVNARVPISMKHVRTGLISSGWATTAVGVGLTIAGIMYGVSATDASDEIDAACPAGLCSISESDVRALYDSGTSDEEISNTLLGVGIGFVTVGLALAITGHVLDDPLETGGEAIITPTWNGLRTTVGRDGIFVETGLTF